MVLMRDGSNVDDPRLGRIPTGHTRHIENYPLTSSTLPSEATPVVIGVNWYSNFDRPVKRGISALNGRVYHRWVIGEGDLGRVRGGHAVVLRPSGVRDTRGWWRFYDQGIEGRCVEFAWLRALSLMNRRRYDITSRWHYWEMQRRDYWAGGSYPGGEPHYEGTSVDAGAQVMRQFGAIRSRWLGRPIDPLDAPRLVRPEEGISVYRWARSWDDVRAATQTPDHMPGVPLLNSWGKSYPHEVLLLDSAGERLLHEDGEMAVATDR